MGGVRTKALRQAEIAAAEGAKLSQAMAPDQLTVKDGTLEKGIGIITEK